MTDLDPELKARLDAIEQHWQEHVAEVPLETWQLVRYLHYLTHPEELSEDG